MDWRLLTYSIWFQLIWLLAVIGNQDLQGLTAVLAVATLLASQFRDPVPLKRLVLLLLLGCSLDLGNVYAGVFEFESSSVPIWLICLWLVFLWYAYFLQLKLDRFPVWLVPLLGGVGGALSYLAGERLGAVVFPLGAGITFTVVFIEWLVMVWLIQKVYGYASSKSSYGA